MPPTERVQNTMHDQSAYLVANADAEIVRVASRDLERDVDHTSGRRPRRRPIEFEGHNVRDASGSEQLAMELADRACGNEFNAQQGSRNALRGEDEISQCTDTGQGDRHAS